MKITKEHPCQRRHHRLTTALHVVYEGQEATLSNDIWSKVKAIRTQKPLSIPLLHSHKKKGR